MDIIVCIKQVPDTTEIKIDPVKNTLIRAGVPSIMNPFDRHALEAARALCDVHGGKVVALSMGPAQAKQMLKEALSVGADEAYLVTDRAFGGSDTYATSYILAHAIRHLGEFDLVLGGIQAIDGDTGQTASSIAEHLDRALVTHALDLQLQGEKLIVKRQIEEGIETVEAALPCVCTLVKESNRPRYASVRSKLSSRSAEIPEIHFEDMQAGMDAARIGLKGSPTRVKSTFVPERTAEGVRIEGDAHSMAAALLDQLDQAKALK